MSSLTGATLVFDVVLAILLVATIVYAVVLNRKLSVLRVAKIEMEALFNRLVKSTQKAESGIESLKGQVLNSGEVLQHGVEAARGLGMTKSQTLWRVELPLAAPVILAGIRTATVWVVGIASADTKAAAKSTASRAAARDLSTQESAFLKALQGMR